MSARPRRGGRGADRASLTEAPFATGIVTKCSEEVHPPECRPVRIDEDALRVRRLPQQKARQPGLATRSNDEMGIWLGGGVEVPRVPRRIYALRHAGGIDAGGREIGYERAGGVDDLLTPAVAKRQVDAEPVADGVLLSGLGRCGQRVRQQIEAADR